MDYPSTFIQYVPWFKEHTSKLNETNRNQGTDSLKTLLRDLDSHGNMFIPSKSPNSELGRLHKTLVFDAQEQNTATGIASVFLGVKEIPVGFKDLFISLDNLISFTSKNYPESIPANTNDVFDKLVLKANEFRMRLEPFLRNYWAIFQDKISSLPDGPNKFTRFLSTLKNKDHIAEIIS